IILSTALGESEFNAYKDFLEGGQRPIRIEFTDITEVVDPSRITPDKRPISGYDKGTKTIHIFEGGQEALENNDINKIIDFLFEEITHSIEKYRDVNPYYEGFEKYKASESEKFVELMERIVFGNHVPATAEEKGLVDNRTKGSDNLDFAINVDSPDDNNSFATFIDNTLSPVWSYADANIQLNGFADFWPTFRSRIKSSPIYHDDEYLLSDIMGHTKVLVIPTGGMAGLSNLEIYKKNIEHFISEGGCIIAFAQQHGYEYELLPRSDELGAYGWREDMSCYTNGATIDTPHVVFSSQTRNQMTASVDGFFSTIPNDATVLLRRTKNGMPAAVMYPYGEGMVIATSLYSDWGSSYGQLSEEERKFIRDLLAWAKYKEVSAEGQPGNNISFDFTIHNNDTLASDSLIINIYTPDHEVYRETRIAQSIPPEDSITHNISLTLPGTLGIWQVQYKLKKGDTLETPDKDAAIFACRLPIQAYSDFPKISYSAQTTNNEYTTGSQASFNIIVKNNTDTIQSTHIGWYLPHHRWMLPIDSLTPWGPFDSLVVLYPYQSISIPYNAIVTKNDNLWVFDWNNLPPSWETLYALVGFIVNSPEVENKVDWGYYGGNNLIVTSNLENKDSPFDGMIVYRLINPENQLIESDTNLLSITPHIEKLDLDTLIIPFAEYNRSDYGQKSYKVTVTIYSSTGKTINTNSFGFVPSGYLDLTADLPSYFTIDENAAFSFNIISLRPSDAMTATFDFLLYGERGDTVYNNSGNINISGDITRIIDSIPSFNANYGNYYFKFIINPSKGRSFAGVITIRNILNSSIQLSKPLYYFNDTLLGRVIVNNPGAFNLGCTLSVNVPGTQFNVDTLLFIDTAEVVAYNFSTVLSDSQTFINSWDSIKTFGINVALKTSSGDEIIKQFQFFVPPPAAFYTLDKDSLESGDTLGIEIIPYIGAGNLFHKVYLGGFEIADSLGRFVTHGETLLTAVKIPVSYNSGTYPLVITSLAGDTLEIFSLKIKGIDPNIEIAPSGDYYVEGDSAEVMLQLTNIEKELLDAEIEFEMKSRERLAKNIKYIGRGNNYSAMKKQMVRGSDGTMYAALVRPGNAVNIYKKPQGGQWTLLTSTNYVSSMPFVSMAIDSRNHLHVVYTNYEDLVYGEYDTQADAWYPAQVLDSWYEIGTSQIAVDGNDVVHLCYDAGGYINYIKKTGSGTWSGWNPIMLWSIDPVMVIGYDNSIHVFAYDYYGWLYYACNDGNSWLYSDVVIAVDYHNNVSAVVDKDNTVYCAYSSETGTNDKKLSFIYKESQGWWSVPEIINDNIT
ncbi:MAG: hypothetical protein ABIA63_02295, partial [bacterium]